MFLFIVSALQTFIDIDILVLLNLERVIWRKCTELFRNMNFASKMQLEYTYSLLFPQTLNAASR